MPNLKVLYLMKNECVKKMKNYRKTIIDSIPTLNYLDDRPVFKDDRRTAEAFGRGGVEEEREERKIMKAEKEQAHEDYHKNFKLMMQNARKEKAEADRIAKEAADAQRTFDEEGNEIIVDKENTEDN